MNKEEFRMKKYLLEKNKEIHDILQEIEDKYKEAKEKQSIIDSIRNDILHEIELNRYSAIQMTKKYKELQATLQIRRRYKDNLEYLKTFKSSLSVGLSNSAHTNINSLHTKFVKRTYNKRIKEEVRNEILSEISDL